MGVGKGKVGKGVGSNNFLQTILSFGYTRERETIVSKGFWSFKTWQRQGLGFGQGAILQRVRVAL